MASATISHAATVEARIRDSGALASFFTEFYGDPFYEVAVDWPGEAFDPPDGPWLQPRMLWGDSFLATMKDSSRNTLVGVLNINCFDKRGTGEGRLNELADLCRDLFNRVTVSGIRFDAPSGPKPPPRNRDGWMQMTVGIPFEVDEDVN